MKNGMKMVKLNLSVILKMVKKMDYMENGL